MARSYPLKGPKKSNVMKTGKKIFENIWVRRYLLGVAVALTMELMSSLVKVIPSSNKLILDLLNQTVSHYLADAEIWKTPLGIAAWIITTFIFALVVLFAWTVVQKLTNIFKPNSVEPPPYEGYTWQLCLKSGVYQARINPDYEVEVMFGKFFPPAVTKNNQFHHTAWKLVRRIRNNSPD